MTPDERVSKWVLAKWSQGGAEVHMKDYGCTISASNVRFGKAAHGACDTCYWEYPALIFDLDCTCPKQVPGKKDPQKLRANPHRFKISNVDIDLDYLGGLATVYQEIGAIT